VTVPARSLANWSALLSGVSSQEPVSLIAPGPGGVPLADKCPPARLDGTYPNGSLSHRSPQPGSDQSHRFITALEAGGLLATTQQTWLNQPVIRPGRLQISDRCQDVVRRRREFGP